MREEKRVPLNLHEEHGRSLDEKSHYTVSIYDHAVATGGGAPVAFEFA
jgi:hypothetical protein